MGRFLKKLGMTEAGPSGKLTLAEQKRFDDLLGEIDAGIDSWRRIGERLKELRDKRFYRHTHSTFESFCQERWNWTRQHVNQHISASGHAELYEKKMLSQVKIGNMVFPNTPQFDSEASVRPLKAVPEAKRDEVAKVILDNAPEDGRITTKVVKEAVAQVCEPETKKQSKRIKCPHCKGRGWTLTGT